MVDSRVHKDANRWAEEKDVMANCGTVRLLAIGALTLASSIVTAAQTPAGSLAALSTQPSMNVFRRFAADRAAMVGFYGDVLALKPLRAIALGGGNEMVRFQVGTSEIKLQATSAAARFPSGSVSDVVGLRVFTIFFPDENALTQRFTTHGYPAPVFRARTGGGRAALVQDPERQWIELVVMPGAPPATFDRFEVGLTVSNLEASRAFYRNFVGLEELLPVEDALLGVTKYPFRHGTMTVNVWSFGKRGLPANPTGAGIQYVISNVEAVDAKAKAEHVTIDRPLGPFGTGLRTIWLADPDGITNYFAQILPPDARPASAPTTDTTSAPRR
jgi:catechol 2,3-dioxygenase-like lactoylglutathione lyase family enzyme